MKMIPIFFLFLGYVVHAAEAKKPSPIDLRSSQGIIFYSKQEMTFSDMGKISEYQGMLVRPNEATQSLRSADLYKFPKETKIKMTIELCQKYADRIFGRQEKRSLKLNQALKLFNTPVGQACEFQMTDSYTKAQRRYRYVISGFIHGRLIALVWSFPQLPSSEVVNGLQGFWQTIR